MHNISIKKPGTLKEHLRENDWKRVKGLKISGPLNDDDLDWLNELTTFNKGLYYVDLFDAKDIEEKDVPLLMERGINNFSIPEGIKDIKKKMLKCLSTNTLNIPKSVFNISKGAFSSCPELKIVNVNEQNLKYKSVNGLLYTKDGQELLFCPPKRDGNISIPEGTLKIAPKAFQGCDKLNMVILPQSIDKDFTGTLSQDFKNKKTEIRWTVDQDHFNLGETRYEQGGKVLTRHAPDPEDYKEGDPHFDLLKKSEYDFSVPNGVEEISSEAFANCFQLRSIKLPNSLITIHEQAFSNCTHLTTIELPSKLKTIDKDCFNGCRNLGKICSWAHTPPKCAGSIIDYTQDKMLYVPKGSIENYKKAKGWKMFKNIREVETLTLINMRTGNGEKSSIVYSPSIIKAELKDYLNDIWHNVVKIAISGKITEQDVAFLRTMATEGQLTDIDLTECHIQQFENKAFADADLLVSIQLPNVLQDIPNSLLIGCKRLKKICIGSETENVGDFAFAECTNLRHIDFSGSTKKIGRGVCWNCKLLETINIGDQLQSIGEDAFRGCDSLKRIDSHCCIPPKCASDTFQAPAFQNAELTFPSGGHAAYLQDTIWNKFSKKIAENILF